MGDTTEVVAREVAVRLLQTGDDLADLRRRKKLLDLVGTPGHTPIRLVVQGLSGKQATSQPGNTVALTEDLVERLGILLGKGNVCVR